MFYSESDKQHTVPLFQLLNFFFFLIYLLSFREREEGKKGKWGERDIDF